MTTSKLVLPCIAVAAALASPAFAQPVLDHTTCYKVKDSAARTKYTATLETASGPQECLVRTPARYACVPTSKSNVSPTPPGGGPATTSNPGSFLCYRAKCPVPTGNSNVSDQFGERTVAFKRAKYLCTPADVGAPSPGVTTTSTTLPAEDNCDFDDGECRGTCSTAGSRCGSVVGSSSCECLDEPCGDADAPSCNGYCAPDEACVFSFTGCSCVDIPN